MNMLGAKNPLACNTTLSTTEAVAVDPLIFQRQAMRDLIALIDALWPSRAHPYEPGIEELGWTPHKIERQTSVEAQSAGFKQACYATAFEFLAGLARVVPVGTKLLWAPTPTLRIERGARPSLVLVSITGRWAIEAEAICEVEGT